MADRRERERERECQALGHAWGKQVECGLEVCGRIREAKGTQPCERCGHVATWSVQVHWVPKLEPGMIVHMSPEGTLELVSDESQVPFGVVTRDLAVRPNAVSVLLERFVGDPPSMHLAHYAEGTYAVGRDEE